MAGETAYIFTQMNAKAMNGEINWLSDTIKAAFLGAGYTFDQDAHAYFSAVSANEVSGSGYTAGGVTLTGKSAVKDDATNKISYGAANFTASGVTISPRFLVIYKSTGTASTSPLIHITDFGQVRGGTNVDIPVTFTGGVVFTHTTP